MQFNGKISTIESTVNSISEKHKQILDESVSRLLGRAEHSHGLQSEQIGERVWHSVEKYLLRDEPKANKNSILQFIEGLNATDLCLIVACENGIEMAWEELVKKFDPTVKAAARSISKNTEDAEDLAGSIWAELYGLKEKDGKVKGKLSYYSGRGSLAGWLRAVVSQLAVDQFRKQSKFVQIEENREFENLANESSEKDENHKLIAHNESPEEILSRTQTQNDIRSAFRDAMQNLESEDKLILKFYYFDELKLKEIGQILGFHEATASRKLVRIQQDLRKSVEKGLAERHGWKQDEVKKYLADSAAKLDISLEKMFGVLVLAVLMQDFFK